MASAPGSRRPDLHPSLGSSAVAASIVVLTPDLPGAVWRSLTILVIELAAVIMITLWSRRPGWGDRQILALAAGALFAYAWHAFISPPAFDSASIVIVRISNAVFAALALAAVWIATRRISDLSDSHSATALRESDKSE